MLLSPPWVGLLGWMAAASLGTFLLFGFDKARARRGAGRISESTLLLACALGGWPGGLLGLGLLRHKSAKGSFQIKFLLAVLLWVALATAVWHLALSD